MSRQKDFRFRAIHTFPNGLDEEHARLLSGRWRDEYFGNKSPIILELGCGKGDYALGLNQLYPSKNIIGIDIKGDRLYVGVKEAFRRGKAREIAFIRGRIDFIEQFFGEHEIDEIWITFPDPQARKREARKRLTGPMFLDRYQKLLKPGGMIHLKTDTVLLFHFTMEQIRERGHKLHESYLNIADIEASRPELRIRTDYEKKHLEQGRSSKYIRFSV